MAVTDHVAISTSSGNLFLRVSGFDVSTMPGFVYDSGESPANGTVIPGSVAVDKSSTEVVVVSRGHYVGLADIGDGSQALLLAGAIGSMGTADLYLYPNTSTAVWNDLYATRLIPTATSWRSNGSGSAILNINGFDYPAKAVTNYSGMTGGKIGGSVSLGGAYDWIGSILRVLVFNAPLSSGDRSILIGYLRWRYGFRPYTKQVICDGDSLTAGYHSSDNFILYGWDSGDYTHSYPYYMNLPNRDWKVLNHGVTAETIANLNDHAAAAIDPYYDATRFAKNVVVIWGGSNDTDAGVSLATVQSDFTSYVSSRQSAGWKVVAIPMLDRSTFDAGQRADHSSFNTWLAGGGSGADRVATLPALLSPDSAWVAHPELWDPDNIHLTRAGYQLMATAIATEVTAA